MSWQGNPELVKHRARLIDNFISYCYLNNFDFAKDEELYLKCVRRPSGKVVCDLCDLTYDEHPTYPYSSSEKQEPRETELCDGDIVHL